MHQLPQQTDSSLVKFDQNVTEMLLEICVKYIQAVYLMFKSKKKCTKTATKELI